MKKIIIAAFCAVFVYGGWLGAAEAASGATNAGAELPVMTGSCFE